jgi:uncharacterized protein (DUF305 family)
VGRDESGALVMPINRAITTIFIAILALSLSGCASTETKDSMHNHASQAAGDLSSDDVMFLQMMIPHHQQAIDISNIALKSSKDVELLALADTIIEAQTAEIVQMSSWLKEAGASMDMGHSMSGMGGMLDEAELSTLAVAKGKEFDALWLKGMIEHHDGAIDMSSMIADASNPEIKAFGENVIKDQSAQIDQMNAMLKRIS